MLRKGQLFTTVCTLKCAVYFSDIITIKKTMRKGFCHGKKSPAGECGLIGACF
ncbi:MAG: hypothetical protein KKE50_00730 [Nanoarchaeota archaeon]|nr:hypothetical protein [Nanoarchaeota archaeon]